VQNFEELMTHANVLNRKLEEVHGVGKEFSTVAELWGVSRTRARCSSLGDEPPDCACVRADTSQRFNTLIRDQQVSADSRFRLGGWGCVQW
jgi:hypothetical protein